VAQEAGEEKQMKKITTAEAQPILDAAVIRLGLSVYLRRWKVRLSKGGRGYCHTHTKLITIPAFAFDIEWLRAWLPTKGFKAEMAEQYMDYYICHEVAHAVADTNTHSDKFMRALIKLCPPEIIQFELGYKPRNAAAAGIKKD
jgi:hypothetical protein